MNQDTRTGITPTPLAGRWRALIAMSAIAATAAIVGLVLPAIAQQPSAPPAWAARWTANNELILPTDYRYWVFVGAPLTPNGLNNGAAAFPEIHNVYIPRPVLDNYLRTGAWRDGDIWVKELQLLQPGEFPDGSRNETSGRGFFPAAFNGLDVMVMDSRRCAETRNWCFFNFGHRPEPYDPVAAIAPRAECSACHEVHADADMHFKRFYTILSQVRR